MHNSWLLYLFYVCCVHISLSSGGTLFYNTVVVEEHGQPVSYCEWNGSRYLPGTDFKDYDECIHCKCKETIMTCSSLLEKVFLSTKDDELSDCKPVKVACEIRWVLKRNRSIPCPAHKIPKHQATI
ncbi:uncharacterized protein LOC123560487 [Mercenaria mercenaria]|uniref:uncharacterized protein LOC123560487 n=1 Tax=Mercenaria mercenaria TaxID=6596 RepID=UPI001E1DBC5E|nr:uncharacterized protein LOC123560487 [Mercenaria mercenaria]